MRPPRSAGGARRARNGPPGGGRTAASRLFAPEAGEARRQFAALAEPFDGDGAAEKLVSVAQENPKDTERYTFSGVFLQKGNAPGTWLTIESSKNDTLSYTVRGAIDLDGDRTHELWINSVSNEGGGGDRIYQLTATGATGLGKWTCGA
jgi:hypothetical protein